MSKLLHGISIVICSYNSEHRIKRVLECLAGQENCDEVSWEVIMVDNASTDNVVEVAKKSWDHPGVPFRLFHEPRQGQSYATRTGIEKASYDVIILVDDDNYVSSNYVSRAYQIMKEHPEVGVAGGKGIGLYEKEPPAWFKDIKQAFAIGPQARKEGYTTEEQGYIYGAGSIFRTSVYNDLMNSDFQLMLKGRIGKSLVAGEDQERSLAFRILGYELWYDPLLEFQHYMPVSRFDWKYCCRLFESFGHASVYHDLYKELLVRPKGIRAIISRYAVLDILRKLYGLSLAFYAYLKVSFSRSVVGKLETLQCKYYIGALSERTMRHSKIRQYRKQLRNATWRKKYSRANVPGN